MSEGMDKLGLLGIFGGGTASSGDTTPAGGYDESLGITVGDINPPTDFVFELSPTGDSYILVQYLNTTDLNPVIPQTYNGLPVTEIGGSAMSARQDFGQATLMLSTSQSMTDTSTQTKPKEMAFLGTGNKLKSVALPDTIVAIGTRAFADNDLTEIVLPVSLTSIGDGAFSNNKITSLVLPASVSSVGSRAFESNNLTQVSLSENLTTISSHMFANNALTTIELPQTVRVISSSAFQNNELSELTLPEGIVSIADSAFRNNKITTVTIPETVATLQSSAFRDNTLTSVTFEGPRPTSLGSDIFTGNTTLPDSSILVPANQISQYKAAVSSFSVTSSKIVINPRDANLESDFVFAWNAATNGWSITNYVNTTSKDVVIPDKRADGLPITTIANNAFQNKGLTSIVLPDNLVAIGQFSFSSNKITELNIPSSVTKIGYGSFQFNNLTEIVIPDSVSLIEGSAFRDNSFRSVIFLGALPNIGTSTHPSFSIFGNGSAESTTLLDGGIKVPAAHLIAYRGKTVQLGVTTYRVSVNPSDSGVENGFAFVWNKTHNGWEIIEYTNKTNKAVVIPATRSDGLPVVSIGNSAFYNNQLTSVMIPNGVRVIAPGAFSTNQLTSIVIPNSVISIGFIAFSNNQLSSVRFLGAMPSTNSWDISVGAFASNPIQNGGVVVPLANLSSYLNAANL